ncbi:MAG: hypothetical protein IPK93_12355 [Solirubrobacterales bacterium]|nr:hypothetical protein [Solirubrobacterales bacterium]
MGEGLVESDRGDLFAVDFDSFEECLVEEPSLFVVGHEICGLDVAGHVDRFLDHPLNLVGLYLESLE